MLCDVQNPFKKVINEKDLQGFFQEGKKKASMRNAKAILKDAWLNL